jgi:hypothetical protein
MLHRCQLRGDNSPLCRSQMPTMKIVRQCILHRVSLIHQFRNLRFDSEFFTCSQSVPAVDQQATPNNDIFSLSIRLNVCFKPSKLAR